MPKANYIDSREGASWYIGRNNKQNVLLALYINFPLCAENEAKIIPLLLLPEYRKSGMCGQGERF